MDALAAIPKYDTYKDSGSNWLGEIPRDWGVTKFKYLARVRKGKIPKRIVSENNSNLPAYLSMEYLRGSEANQFVEDKNPVLVEDGSILLLWDGSNAGEFILGKRGVVSSTLASIDFFSVTEKFAWYACQVTEMQLRSATVGMGIPHVDGNQLKNSFLAIPSIADQKLIANFLDNKTTQIEDAISIKEKQIALLKERKQIIIQKAVTQGLNPDVPMKDSGVEWIGKIPAHWDLKPLYAVLEFISYGFTNPMPTEEDGPYMLTSNDIGDGYIKYESSRRTSFASFKLKLSMKSKPTIGDLLVTKDGTLGRTALVRSDDKMCISQSVALLRFKKVLVNEFVELAFRAYKYQEKMILDAGGTTIKHIYISRLAKMKVALPPLKEQKCIVEKLDFRISEIDTACNLLSQQLETLKEYKATLINSAVTGKIKVV